MNNIIAVASGKGGVGKSTICCHIGKAFSNKNERTVLIETDVGLRGLDIFLNVKDIVYDLGDYIEGDLNLEKILYKTPHNNLFLIPAPLNFNIKIKKEKIIKLCEELKKYFKNIIIDLKAGIEIALELKEIVNLFLIVVTPDAVSVRDASFFVNFLEIENLKKSNVKLIVNKINKNFNKNSNFKTLDDIIDETKIQLIGAIPFSEEIKSSIHYGLNLKQNKKPFKIFNAISNRINNQDEKLILR